MRIERFDRLRLGSFPTPMYRLNRASEKLGVSLYVKRDDMPFVSLGGNKIRKLEFLMADVIRNGSDVIVTTGGTQSNWAQLSSVVAAMYGIRSVLLLTGSEDTELQGNYLIDRVVDAEVRWIKEEAYDGINEILEETAKELKNRGMKPYVIPVGGTTSLGDIGYVLCALEIVEQSTEMDVDIDYIVVAAGSGGTMAGLLLGTKMFNPDIKVIGVSIARTAEDLKGVVSKVANESAELLGVDVRVDEEDVCILDQYIGEGYAKRTQGAMDAIKFMLKNEGILLDPVYTGKTFGALIEEIKKENFREGNNVLFIHTGGYGGVFGFNNYFR